MDKRSLLFVLALSASLFLVNLYFESQRKDSTKEWVQKQEAKKQKKLSELETDLATRTISLADLPIVEIFQDIEGKQKIADGIGLDNQLIAFRWTDQLPNAIYVRPRGGHLLSKLYYLKFGSDHSSGVVMYEAGAPNTLQIADLPDFGHYTLQMVSLKGSPTVLLADSTEGHISIVAEQIALLRKEQYPDAKVNEPEINNGFLLMHVDNRWVPAAVYIADTKTIVYLEDIPNLHTEFLYSKAKRPTMTPKGVQQYYVIENDYQQLVFTNIGGSLAEINLPFQSELNKKSVVLPVEFDRQMVKDDPQNARFPAYPYQTPGDSNTGKYSEHLEGRLGGYYPLLRRDLIQKDSKKTIRIPPKFYALNLVSEFPEVAEQVYEVTHFSPYKIVFENSYGHRKIVKTYTVEPDGGPYTFNLEIKIEGDARGLWINSGIPEVEWISGGPAPSLKYRLTRQGSAEVLPIDLPKDVISMGSVTPDWFANSNGFLGTIVNPLNEVSSGLRTQYLPGSAAPSRLLEIDQSYHIFQAEQLPGYMMQSPLNPAGGTMRFRIFAGPFSGDILKVVDRIYSDPETGYTPDYIATQTFHGWFAFISEPFAKFLFILMKFFHGMTNSWGLSIILLTVALRVMLYPLNQWSINSTVKMQQIAPEVAAIQERYKKDPKRSQLEIINLYRDRGINPLSGCFPLLIQIPFLIGMFDLLKSTFELRGAPFIPGWIDDLSAPDVLFSWNYPLFFIGHQFHLLPFLLGAVMFVQQTMMSPIPKDPAQMTDQQRQQKAMGNIMTVVFTLMFYHFPSGLNIYWLSSMVLGIIQQWWATKWAKSKVVSQPVSTRK